jgi:DNA-binding MarR family transcriptional regulator
MTADRGAATGSTVESYLIVQETPPDANGSETDHVDKVRRQWAHERPDLDTGPIGIIARLGRAQAYINPALDSVFADRGLTRRSWDALAALRRVGEPYRLTPTELCQDLMRTSGAITHTLHRLEYAGLVERLVNPEDGRSLYVALTPRALELTDTIAPLHLDNERRLLAGLTPDEQHTLAHLLRKLLLSFERDRPAPTPPAGRASGQAPRAPQGVTTRGRPTEPP